jgi:hypothetical protein
MPQPDVLYVADLAARLGRTVPAIRQALRRKSSSVPHEHVFALGGELVIKREDYEAWLLAKKAAGRMSA